MDLISPEFPLEYINNTSLIYEAPAILSLQFSTVLMIIDFIIPCVTNKKVKAS